MTATAKMALVLKPTLEQLKNMTMLKVIRKRNAICLMLFTLGNIRWYILEGEKTNNDFTLYGIVVGLCETEYGYISLNELSQVSIDANRIGLGKLYVEQDLNFKPCAIGEIQDKELQSFLSSLY